MMAVYAGVICLLVAFGILWVFQEKKRRKERRQRLLRNLHTALDA